LRIFDILSFSLKQLHPFLHCPLALKYNFSHLKTFLRWLVLKGLQSAIGSSIPLTRHSGSGEMPAGSGRSSHLQLLFLRKTQRALGTMGHPILGLACWFAFPWCSSRLPGQCRHRQHSRCTNQSVGGGEGWPVAPGSLFVFLSGCGRRRLVIATQGGAKRKLCSD
jgi:hypothetical protein